MAKTQPLSSKILVTNRAALVGKYGTAGVKNIEKAVDGLIRADGKRGLKTRLIYLDGGALKRRRVKDPADPVENKAAVDAVARKHRPEYLVILGSHDVVPYQDLKNKLHEAGDPDSDPDRFAPSDLPYACEAPYSQSAAKFLGPTRVVGRIPDLTGASRPTYLIRLLASSATAKGLKRPESAFALSAKVWEKSTKTSVRNMLGAVPTVLTSPKKGPRFGKAALGAKVHFVNCHGDKEDHTFAGEFPEERVLHGCGRAETSQCRPWHRRGVRVLLRRAALRSRRSAGDEHRQHLPRQGRRWRGGQHDGVVWTRRHTRQRRRDLPAVHRAAVERRVTRPRVSRSSSGLPARAERCRCLRREDAGAVRAARRPLAASVSWQPSHQATRHRPRPKRLKWLRGFSVECV